MSRFDECLRFMLEVEGGYSNHSADRGGATSAGITQAVYDDWRIGKGFGRMPVVGISPDEVSSIYRDRYWKAVRGDSLPRGIDLVTFDAAVNHGPRQAILFLQRALGVDDDGQIGPMTIGAALSDDAAGMTSKVIADILDQRTDFYDDLVARNNSQRVFLNGWHNRITKLRKELAK